MRQLRIAQISKEYSTNGGVGTYLLNLCPALEAAGHKVIVIHADPNASLATSDASGQFFVEGFDRFVAENNGRGSASSVVKILEALKPDIVHIQSNNNFLLEHQIHLRFPTIKTLHVYDFCPSGNKFHHALGKVCHHPTGPLCLPRMGYKRCLLSKRPSVIWWHYRRCVEANRNNAKYPKLIVASEYVKQQAVASRYPPTQIEALPYFTELPELSTAADNGKNSILFVGRVVREKGLDRLLSAVSLVRTSWCLIVDGDGMDLGRTKSIAHSLGLSGQIEFAGWADRERHLRFYREASVVVVPSIWPEPFGLVGIEAMSYGKPVVAFKIGGIPEWLEDGVTGFLITPYDVKQMADKISYLLEHPDLAHRMGMKGRTKVEQEFNMKKHITRLLEIYREVSDGRTQPPDGC